MTVPKKPATKADAGFQTDPGINEASQTVLDLRGL